MMVTASHWPYKARRWPRVRAQYVWQMALKCCYNLYCDCDGQVGCGHLAAPWQIRGAVVLLINVVSRSCSASHTMRCSGE